MRYTRSSLIYCITIETTALWVDSHIHVLLFCYLTLLEFHLCVSFFYHVSFQTHTSIKIKKVMIFFCCCCWWSGVGGFISERIVKIKTIFFMNYQGLMSHRASYWKQIIFCEIHSTSGLHKSTLPTHPETICFVKGYLFTKSN